MISVTYLVKKYDIHKTITLIEETDADYIHVDMMDGKFVKPTTHSLEELKTFLTDTKKKLDVHLMVANPEDYIDELAKLNTEFITFHYEAINDVHQMIENIHNHGMKAGIAINPDTPITSIKPYLNALDLVLVLSVEPGYGGQKFIENTYSRIEELNDLKGSFLISVDGGVNNTNAKTLVEKGVDILVVGSYICTSDDYNERIETLKCL